MQPIIELEAMLKAFTQLPRFNAPHPTFMEIAGFPHYENVCSNILAFYFDTNQPHGLKDLFIKALSQCLENPISEPFSTTNNVLREEVTSSNKRIDILIMADDVVVAIENKIYADLYNDLEDYSLHLDHVYENFQKLKVVLSLNSVHSGKLTNGFVNVTYNAFLDKVKANLGFYAPSADAKYLLHLNDFMLTISNLKKMITVEPKVIEFFIKNKASIEELIAAQNDIRSLILRKIHQLQGNIKELPVNVRQWVYEKFILVHDFTFPDGVVVAVDCMVELEGITIRVWVRKGNVSSKEYMGRLSYFRHNPISEPIWNDNRLIVYGQHDIPLSIPTSELAEILNNILEQINLEQ